MQFNYFPGGISLSGAKNSYDILGVAKNSLVEVRFVYLTNYKSIRKKTYKFKINATDLLQRYCIVEIIDITKRSERRKMHKDYYIDYSSP